MSKSTKAARLTALALATGTLVVGATGSAGAAPVRVPDVFGGNAKGVALNITINLPVPLPGVGSTISQEISFTEGLATKDTAKVASIADAVLGKGIVAPLNISANSSLSGKPSDSKSIANFSDLPGGLIKGGLGTISTSVAPDNATSALTSTGSSSLLNLEIGALPALPVGLDVEGLVDSVQAVVDGAQGSVTQALDTALGTLNEVSQGATAPVAEEIKKVQEQLTDLVDNLQTTVSNLAGASLLEIGLLESTNTITRKGDMVEAKATSAIGDLSILGGLVTVEAVKTESVSSANGVKGAAAADTLTTVLGLKVGDLLTLKLTDKGLEGSLLGNSLPPAASGAVNTVIGAVNNALAVAGVNIVYGQTTKTVDPNGQSAASSSQGVGIVVNPPVLNLAKPLLSVTMVEAGTAVNAARLSKPVVNPPRVAPPTNRPLPRTGAELPLFAVVGTGLAGAALVARRRKATV
jgi:LPXTG-motif cell wall-anchored protein